MDRRQFMLNTLVGLGAAPLYAARNLPSYPFTLGIASGDVTASSTVLWTRLAPAPMAIDGGMPNAGMQVQWLLSQTPDMAQIVQRGETLTQSAWAHSVHVEVDNLEAGREYWYQFRAGNHVSPIGRTKTLAAGNNALSSARFVTASCQNYTHGYFVAYRHMVADQPDFVIHLGDYIYDTSFGETFRQHDMQAAPATLDDFRRRHALYKTDRDLQHAHAQIPFFLSIDNHDALEDNDPAKAQMRAAAYQAWYEHMPVRGYQKPGDNHFDIHRRIAVGNLARISMLDSRQFRDKREICTGEYDPDYGFGNYRTRCPAVFEEDRSMLGDAQERWLTSSLIENESTWNVLASPGPFLPFSYRHKGEDLRYIGAWDAYPANRARVMDAFARSGSGHPLVLSGDVHSFWALDGARATSADERFPLVEFVTSAISANWPPPLAQPVTDNLPNNPQVTFYDPVYRGYLLHEVNSRTWTTHARGIEDMRDPHSAVRTLARFTVRHGQAGFQQDTGLSSGVFTAAWVRGCRADV
ncbi:MAG: alkaline phosphatase D family protein [bacterium]